jgi:hypothetical protein
MAIEWKVDNIWHGRLSDFAQVIVDARCDELQ